MKKKLLKIFVVFVLLFSIGISKVSALDASDDENPAANGAIFYTVAVGKLPDYVAEMWYPKYTTLCANQGICKSMGGVWNVYGVQTSQTQFYILYCLNMKKSWIKHGRMNEYNSLDQIRFFDDSLSEATKRQRLELLKRLLLFGDNEDPSNTMAGLDLLSKHDTQVRLIAMQILIWEVMEGGRTSFDTIEPQWNGSASFYNRVILPNKKGVNGHLSLYDYYVKYINDAKNGEQGKLGSAFGKTHTLKWNNGTKKYQADISTLGAYSTCESSDKDVTVKVSSDGNSVSVSTTKSLSSSNKATITCKYFTGTGAVGTEESYKFFRFRPLEIPQYQDMIYGNGWKVFSASFDVITESTSLNIKKQDETGHALSGSEFKLSHQTVSNYSLTFKPDTDTKTIAYSGQYTVSETKTPAGYEKIRDFSITISGETQKITNCDGRKPASGTITSCLNGQVGVSYDNNTIVLTIKNVPKNFKISKVNSAGSAVPGAKFEIRNSNNQVVKFSKSNGLFKYDTAGTLTNLYDSTLAVYPISLLPEGEYSIVEIEVPYPYTLPSDEKYRTTKFKIDSNRNLLVYDKSRKTYTSSGDATIKIKNFTTKVVIHKVGNGNPLEGVVFELYNSEKSVKIKCNQSSSGVYEYNSNQSLSTLVDTYVTNSKGNIVLNYLPEGTYYVKEIQTVGSFPLPEGDAAFTEIVIKIDDNGVSINNGGYSNNTIEISNTPFSFNFYKRDTEGNALTTGQYKLQKYDSESKKYIDIKLTEVENDGTYNSNTDIYKEDKTNGKVQFTLRKGVATFIDMDASTTYRILETKAPDGYTKASTKDAATVTIDEYGNASGLLVLVDQKIVKEDDSAYAELIINIQTGKQRIMYGAIIVLVVGIIAGLIIYNRKK